MKSPNIKRAVKWAGYVAHIKAIIRVNICIALFQKSDKRDQTVECG